MNYDTSVTLAFFSGQGRSRIFTNIMRALAGEFSHVEIIFDGYEACSIVQQGTVYYTHKKTFSRDGWSFLTLYGLPAKSVKAMREFCLDQAAMHAGFDMRGMSRAASPVPKSGQHGKWFCSQLVATALIRGGLLPASIVPSALTPSGLYKLVRKYVPPSQVMVGYHPYFEDRLYDTEIDVLKNKIKIKKPKTKTDRQN